MTVARVASEDPEPGTITKKKLDFVGNQKYKLVWTSKKELSSFVLLSTKYYFSVFGTEIVHWEIEIIQSLQCPDLKTGQ